MTGGTSDPDESRLRRYRRAAGALATIALAIHFFRFARGGLRSWFSTDDAMNLYFAWSHPLSGLLTSLVAVFTPYIRPLGQAYYLALYTLFGFDPLAFNVVRMGVAALDVVVMFLFVSRMLNSRTAGVCALILVGIHPALFSIYIDTGMIYDALAFLFYYFAFWLYLGIRQRGKVPGWRAMAGLLALYTCALNSKEIAVTLPVAVLLYELVFAPPRPKFRAVLGWLRREGRFAAAGAVLTALYIAGKMLGPHSLYAHPSYHPDYSLWTYLSVYGRYLAAFLNRPEIVSAPATSALLAGSVALAALTRRRALLWAALFNLVAILPIAFIVARLGFAFYVPLAGWAVLLAGMVALATDFIEARVRAGGGLHPGLRRLAIHSVVVAVLALIVVPRHDRASEWRYAGAHNSQLRIRTWYREVRYLLPTFPRGARLLLLDGPPGLNWSLNFLLPLALQDRGLRVNTLSQIKEIK
ncbi:MAG TPA: hypothetical protein VF767_00970, partial [Bryobacteraceae bacterium]